MITNVWRFRFMVVGCMAAVALPAQVCGPAGASPAPDAVAMAATGEFAADGTVTLSGTYRCAPGHRGTVFVSSKLVQGGAGSGIGGTIATCDGRPHPWTNQGRPHAEAAPGAAQGEATLLLLDTSRGFVPVPVVLAMDRRDLELAGAR